jgi:hypothetical protein
MLSELDLKKSALSIAYIEQAKQPTTPSIMTEIAEHVK